MQVQFALGAEVDIASSDELDAAKGDILDVFEKSRPVRPMYYSLSQAIVVAGTFTGICRVGTPAVGRIWNILGYSALGDTDNTASTAGTVSLYVGNVPANGNPSLSQVRDAGLVVPSGRAYGENVHWCPPGQEVFFKLTGITGLTQFVGNVFVGEYREDDLLQRSGR